jgi:hypothetical protein
MLSDCTSFYFTNDPSCFGYCPGTFQTRVYSPTGLAFCNGCSDQTDLIGCNPFDTCHDPDNVAAFAVRIAGCPVYNLDGSFDSCQPMSAGDYIDWYCPITPEEMAMHRAHVLMANGVEHDDALAVTSAPRVRPFRPCRHHPPRPRCIFCHSVAHHSGYAEGIDLRCAGEKTVRVGFGEKCAATPLPPKRGIGVALGRLAAAAGVQAQAGCGCNDLEGALDRATPEGVLENVPQFAASLKANAVKLGHAEAIEAEQPRLRELTGDPTLDVYEFLIRSAVEAYRQELAEDEARAADDGLRESGAENPG